MINSLSFSPGVLFHFVLAKTVKPPFWWFSKETWLFPEWITSFIQGHIQQLQRFRPWAVNHTAVVVVVVDSTKSLRRPIRTPARRLCHKIVLVAYITQKCAVDTRNTIRCERAELMFFVPCKGRIPLHVFDIIVVNVMGKWHDVTDSSVWAHVRENWPRFHWMESNSIDKFWSVEACCF